MKQSENQNESNIDNKEDKNKKLKISKIEILNQTQKSENQISNNNPIIKDNLLTE